MGNSRKYICEAALKKRGWTDRIIKVMRIYPEKFARNPHHAHAADMKLYSLDRVRQIEMTNRFRFELAKTRNRKILSGLVGF